MTNLNLTDITIVLDRSGSMASVKDATIEAFNGFLHSQKTGDGDVQLSLVQFDDQYEPLLNAVPMAQVADLTPTTFEPRGSTALLDAIGRTIVETGQRLSQMPEPQRPGTVVFVIQTDGFENASHNFRIEQINSMIAEQRQQYSWEFIFLGANQDAIASASQYGIGAGQALSYSQDAAGTLGAFRVLERKFQSHRTARAQGDTAAKLEFTDADRHEASPT